MKPRASVRVPAWAHVLLALAAVALVAPVVGSSVRNQSAEAADGIVAMAALTGRLLDGWLEERWLSAGLSGTSFPQAGLYQSWRDAGDEHARDRLFLRLEQFAVAGGFSNVALLSPTWVPLWAARSSTGDVAGWAAATWPDGARPGDQAFLDVDWRDLDDPILAIAVALPTEPEAPAPVVVYLLMPEDLASGQLRAWSIANSGIRTSVFRGTVDGVIGVTGASDDLGSSLQAWSLPWSAEGTPGVDIARGEVAPLAPTSGDDERGVRVLAAGQSFGGEGWFVMAQRDRAEVWSGVAATVATGAAFALLFHLAGLTTWSWFRSRQVKLTARATARAEADRAQALRLLRAVADASPDAIFAKDRDGRYLFFNRAASAIVGKSQEDVLGRDDRALFPPEQAEALMENERRVLREGRVATFEEMLTTTAGERVFLANRGPLRDGEGRLIGTFGISRDVTERLREAEAVAAQARDLAQSVAELERFNRVVVDRELAMIELKRRLNEAMRELGRPAPYTLPDADGTERGRG